MIRLPVRKLKQGMIVAQSIFNKHGASYLVKGQPISPEYISHLEHIGIQMVSVTSENPNFHLPPPEDVVQETTRITAIEKVYDAFQSVEETGRLDADAMLNVSDKILMDIIQRKENLVQLTDIRLHDTYTFAHCVNVAILSAMLGMLCRYSKDDLKLLTLGAMLHDLGKIRIPSNILNKNGRLADDEFKVIKSHPAEGAARIKEMERLLPSPGILAAIAAQHHEHVDGCGYPAGLTGEKIHRFAKIVAIADVYDALTSERPYKKAYAPSVTHNIMVNVNKGQFDDELLKLFFNNVAIYPVGTIVKTNHGIGIVKSCEFGSTEMPEVVVFATSDGKLMNQPLIYDLKDDGPKAVKGVISDNDLRHFVHLLAIDPSIFLME